MFAFIGKVLAVVPNPTGITSANLALIVNDEDPFSIRVAQHYQIARRIPPENVIHIRIKPVASMIDPAVFDKIKMEVDRRTPAHVQAYLLAWTLPYRVGCMSITSAFAFGFDSAFCAEGCKPTKTSSYFSSMSEAPFSDFGVRPTMMLAGLNESQVDSLIDRGVRADYTQPDGTAYLVTTGDKARSTRTPAFRKLADGFHGSLKIRHLETEALTGKKDVLFYFTGAIWVEGLDTLEFLPGAAADHLTSAGGVLDGIGQMSILRWLEAGATASYGAVVEPCNYPQKFPHPGIFIANYLRGESLIESYWKSVAWPGQGVFVGEPLARPFALKPGTE
ncbi:MAG: TIGR03790 family protein [Chromatiaceae bacterium]|nr:TIGR03790 family protein [Chromatiaceae bacterium]